MSFIDSFEHQLVEAAERQRDARLSYRLRRLFRRFPRGRGPAVVLAALIVGVPAATAAIAGWNPFDDPGRNPRFQAPSVSQRPIAPGLAAQLAVLRRPQDAADRGVATADAARSYSAPGFRGAQVDGIRLLDAERGIVLVPFERGPVPTDANGQPLPGFDARRASNIACVFEKSGDGYAGSGCHDAAKIRAGLAISSGSGRVSGLVPDRVARVRLIRGDQTAEAAVANNLFVIDESPVVAPQKVEWLAADGRVIRRIDLAGPPRGRIPPVPPPPTP